MKAVYCFIFICIVIINSFGNDTKQILDQIKNTREDIILENNKSDKAILYYNLGTLYAILGDKTSNDSYMAEQYYNKSKSALLRSLAYHINDDALRNLEIVKSKILEKQSNNHNSQGTADHNNLSDQIKDLYKQQKELMFSQNNVSSSQHDLLKKLEMINDGKNGALNIAVNQMKDAISELEKGNLDKAKINQQNAIDYLKRANQLNEEDTFKNNTDTTQKYIKQLEHGFNKSETWEEVDKNW
ncbi:DUF4175 family protein [Spirochaeta cellobiosiphila]|uniref:DUF4175 family protein n=1 Tax=Spirochaeta cellobiosiphila TaxID=504483 RepID=UPI0004118856|nr:DUF4175 family protein [Spirochaeta cellobiosiphila]